MTSQEKVFLSSIKTIINVRLSRKSLQKKINQDFSIIVFEGFQKRIFAESNFPLNFSTISITTSDEIKWDQKQAAGNLLTHPSFVCTRIDIKRNTKRNIFHNKKSVFNQKRIPISLNWFSPFYEPLTRRTNDLLIDPKTQNVWISN